MTDWVFRELRWWSHSYRGQNGGELAWPAGNQVGRLLRSQMPAAVTLL